MKYINELIKAIKQKPELSSIDNLFIETQIVQFIKKHIKIIKKIEFSKSFIKFQHSQEYKQILKIIRGNIRKSYGMFQLNFKKRNILLKKLKQDPNNLIIHTQILKTHRSTKERLTIYPTLYHEIFKFTKNPKSILDLGCGMNPLSYPYMKLKGVLYIASELSKQDTDFIKQYFKIKNIKNKTLPLNLIKEYPKLRKLKIDTAFLFKLLDSLEVTQKGISEKLLKSINAGYIIASFSTRTIGNKPMRNTRRKWFEYLITKLNFQFKILEYPNELFYILTKSM